MPIFGGGKNGLEFADNFFNSLAKGSSDFMNDMRELSKPLGGKTFNVEIAMDTAEQAKRAESLFSQAGAQVEVTDTKLKISGDLGKVLLKAVDDAEILFNNQGEKLLAAYNFNGRDVVRTWWTALNKVGAALTKQKEFRQARVISEVQKRALEPGYNFYGITATRVRDHVGMLTFMLIFYVVYTLWFGYGIFEVFEGIGLGMGKAASKKEV